MHQSAYIFGEGFFSVYCKDQGPIRIAEIGSQNINGALRDHRPKNCIEYLGMDFESGKGVDLVLEDAYSFPIEDNSYDAVVTSSCFEHSEMFWVTFLEAMRILKPHGLLYCNAPSAWMPYHRFPVDCWRFYPDAAKGLQTWANRNKISAQVLESFIGMPDWNIGCADWTAVFIKDVAYIDRYKNRMVDYMQPKEQFFNGYRYPSNERFPNGWKELTGFYLQGQSPMIEVKDGKIVKIHMNG